jgi:acid phosphatase type 7
MRTNLSAVLFLGDMAYEFWQNNGKNFSDWLNDIDTLAKRYPLMMSAGNHEANFNYSFFDQRLQMPLYDQNKGNR